MKKHLEQMRKALQLKKLAQNKPAQAIEEQPIQSQIKQKYVDNNTSAANHQQLEPSENHLRVQSSKEPGQIFIKNNYLVTDQQVSLTEQSASRQEQKQNMPNYNQKKQNPNQSISEAQLNHSLKEDRNIYEPILLIELSEIQKQISNMQRIIDSQIYEEGCDTNTFTNTAMDIERQDLNFNIGIDIEKYSQMNFGELILALQHSIYMASIF